MTNYTQPAFLITDKKIIREKRLSLDKKPMTLERFVYLIVLTLTGLSIVYLLPIFITGNSWLPFSAVDMSSSELTLSLIECILGAAALHFPMLMKKLTHIKIPDTLCAFFYIFVLCATVLGEVFSLYYKVPVWDSLLHGSSGAMIGMLGSILVVSYFHKKNLDSAISPVFVAVAAVCFALSIGVFWEIYEFAGDNLLGLNMQKSLLQDGTALLGKAALFDTMKDLIVDSVGAVFAAVSSYLSLKQKKGWLYSYLDQEPVTISENIPYEI